MTLIVDVLLPLLPFAVPLAAFMLLLGCISDSFNPFSKRNPGE